jgi:hypothetical protein
MKKIVLVLVLVFIFFPVVFAIESSLQATVRVVQFLEGDVNKDCKVDIFDLAAVGLAYGSIPGNENWNPNADLNKNGVVNIFDLAIVGWNYGKEC